MSYRTSTQLDDEAQKPSKWIEWLARFGYAAKGVVYALVGLLAFQAAWNWGGQVTGSKGAFRTVASQPFGSALLFIVAVGLVGYVIWRFVQTIYDPEHSDSGLGAIGRRLSYFVSGLIYSGLAFTAFQVVFNRSSGSSGGNDQQTQMLMAQPFGRFLVALVAVAAAGYGFYCLYRAFKVKFRRKLKLHQMSPNMADWVVRIGRIGLTARGIVMLIVSYFFVQAARSGDPQAARSTEGALERIQSLPFGGALMGIVAFGLIAYGLHLMFQARYRRISP